jgi:K+-sensing histidine kinase KdpD
MVSVTKRYGLSAVLVLSALFATLLVRPEILVGPVFLLAVILSAWLGGMGPGLVAALLATLAIDSFFLPPKYTLRFNPAELPELLAFLVSAVVVSAWAAIRTRTETSLRRTRDELDERVRESFAT